MICLRALGLSLTFLSLASALPTSSPISKRQTSPTAPWYELDTYLSFDDSVLSIIMGYYGVVNTSTAIFDDSGNHVAGQLTPAGSWLLDQGGDQRWGIHIPETPDNGTLYGGASRGQYPISAKLLPSDGTQMTGVASTGFSVVPASGELIYTHPIHGVRGFYACRIPCGFAVEAQWYWQGPTVHRIPHGCEKVNVTISQTDAPGA